MSQALRTLANDIQSYVDDPLGYVLYAFPWGKVGTPLEGYPDGPDEWQIDMFMSLSARIGENRESRAKNQDLSPILDATTSGHGIGKSACVGWLILWLMSTRSVKGVVTANTGTQLEGKTWQELKKWHSLAVNADWFRWTATKFVSTLDELSVVECVPWSVEKPEAFAGLHNEGKCVLLMMDEASAINDVIFEVAEGALTDRDAEIFWFCFGNPTRNTGRFRECFPPGRFAGAWNQRTVDSRTVRITNKKQIEKWRMAYGDDSDFFRVRVKGQFPRSSTNQYISGDLTREAMDRKVEGNPEDLIAVGCDVARFGTNETVIIIRRGRRVVEKEIYRYHGLSTVEVSNELQSVIERTVPRPDGVMVDGAGVGGGVVDIMRQKGYRVYEINGGNSASRDDQYANKRAEMWGEMREWLATADIPDDMDLYRQMIGVEYGFDNKNRVMLEKKEDMIKRGLESPDIADAITLTFGVKLRSNDYAQGHDRSYATAITEYDMLDTGDM